MRHLKLNCTRCGQFTDAHQKRDDPSTVVRCNQCSKKHSDDSLYMVDPNRKYKRDETGQLIEDLP